MKLSLNIEDILKKTVMRKKRLSTPMRNMKESLKKRPKYAMISNLLSTDLKMTLKSST